MSHDSKQDKTNKSHILSEQEFGEFFALLAGTGDFFIFRESFVKFLSRDASLTLQKFINRYSWILKKHPHKQNNGWFVFSVRKLEKSLEMKRDCQIRVLNELKGITKEGVIESRVFIEVGRTNKTPPQRKIRINFRNLMDALREANKPEPLDPKPVPSNNGKPRRLNNDTPNNGKPRRLKNGESRRSILGKDTNVSSIQEEGSKPDASKTLRQPVKPLFDLDTKKTVAHQIAEELFDIVSKNNKIVGKPKMSFWEQDINKILKDRTSDQIRHLLKFYKEYFGQKFIPEIYSASGLLKKFANLESAMKKFDYTAFNKKEEITHPKIDVVLKSLNNEYNWPDPKSLRKNVNLSLLTYDRLKEYVVTTIEKYPRNKIYTYRAFLVEMGTSLGHYADHFVTAWFGEVGWRTEKGDWEGNLQPFAFLPGSKMFKSWVNRLSAEAANPITKDREEYATQFNAEFTEEML